MRDALARLSDGVGTRQTTTFAVLTLVLSWGVWGLVAAATTGPPPRLALAAGAFGPPVAAVAIVGASDRSLREWLRSRLQWRVAPRWYLVALAVPLTLAAVVSAAVVLAGGSLDASVLPRRLGAVPLLLVFTALVGGGQEELGWRGFAQPRLRDRFDATTASLLVGGLWALWHLPLFWLGAPRNGTGSFALYAALVVGFAVVLGWLYDATGGSVLPAVLLHAGVNTSGSVVPATVETLEGLPLATDVAGTVGMTVIAVLVVALGSRAPGTPHRSPETTGDDPDRTRGSVDR